VLKRWHPRVLAERIEHGQISPIIEKVFQLQQHEPTGLRQSSQLFFNQKCFYKRRRRNRRFSSLANLQRELVIVGAFHAGQNHAGNTIFQNQLVKVNQ
jgi:hypothetical protein